MVLLEETLMPKLIYKVDLKIPSYHTKTYGRYSMFVNSIYVWNFLQSCHQNAISHQLRANKLKEILITFFLNRYNSQNFRTCLQIFSFTQNKLALKPIQDFSSRFVPAIRELSAVKKEFSFDTP